MTYSDQFLGDADPQNLLNIIRKQGQDIEELRQSVLAVQQLKSVAEEFGTRVDTNGFIGVTKLNRILFFSAVEATPFIEVPADALTGSNIFEVILTGQFFQNTGANQTVTPKFYIGKSGSETLVTSDTALSVSSGSVRKSFEYRIRVTAAPGGGTKVQVDERFDLENAAAGSKSTIMRSTRTVVIDISQLSEIDSCFIRIINGATATMFRIFTNTVSVQVLDAVQANEIHWYSQPSDSEGKDTYIRVNTPTTNYGSQASIVFGGSTPNVYRSLLKFIDLSNFQSDPDLVGFQISEAQLIVTVATDSSSNARTVELFAVSVPWDDLQATWNNRLTGTAWNTPGLGAGTDYDSTVLASVSFSASELPGVAKAFIFNAAGIAVLQAIIDGTRTDYGFFMKSQTEVLDVYSLYSADSGTPDYAPILYLIGSRQS